MPNLPVPTLASESPGNSITGALWTSNIFNGLTFLLNPPCAALSQITTQSVANNTATPVTFDGEALDSYGGHSTVTNSSRYVAQVAGIYFVMATVTFATNATGIRVAQIDKNGTVVPGSYFAGGATNFNASATTHAMVSLAAGDYVELYGNQSSGGALSTVANDSQMTIWLMHV